MKHVKLTQTGRTQTYTQKVAAAFNWYRRCVMGLQRLVEFQSGYFIRTHPEFTHMSEARKAQLVDIEYRKGHARIALSLLLNSIEEFQRLPITLEDERRGKLPKRRGVPREPLPPLSETHLLDAAESLGAERTARGLVYMAEADLRRFAEWVSLNGPSR